MPVASMLSAALFPTGGQQVALDVYNTALEYIFYIFFFLCLFCIVVALIEERLRLAGFKAASRRIDTASHPVSRHPICHDRRLRRVLCQPVLMSTSSNRVTRFSISLLVWCMDAVARA